MSLGVSHNRDRVNGGAMRVSVPGSVRLQDILDGMEFQSDELTAYLHRPTGRVIAVSEEALQAAEEGTGVDDVDELELADARGILEGGDDYLALPDRFEIDEYRMMERFAGGVADPAVQAELSDALRGRGAFRRFKDGVRRFGLAEEWYRYRDRGYTEVALAWCEAHGITVAPPQRLTPNPRRRAPRPAIARREIGRRRPFGRPRRAPPSGRRSRRRARIPTSPCAGHRLWRVG
jgi:hypothetical protein